MKRMMHPVHGWTHVYNDSDERVMRSNGWVDDASVDEIKPKRGRPKHEKTDEKTKETEPKTL